MKNILKITSIALLAVVFFAFISNKTEKFPTLTIGSAAPLSTEKLKAVDNSTKSLNEFKKENGLLVIFTSNSCPFVVGSKDWDGWEGRYNATHKASTKNEVGMVLINSNAAKRDGAESFEKMQKRAKSNNYKSAYLLDKDSKLANAFGAKTTPHVFLFDKDMKLVYVGAIDDNCNKIAEVKSDWLSDALINLAGKKAIDPNSTRNKGCSIKRKID